MANEYLTTSGAGLDFIINEEALIDGIYNDPKGYATFGVGHLLHADKKPSLLLAAAKKSDTFTSFVRVAYGVKYLACAAAFQPGFSDLKAAAVTLATGVDRLALALHDSTQPAVAQRAAAMASRIANEGAAFAARRLISGQPPTRD